MTEEQRLTSDIIEELTAPKGVAIPTDIFDPVTKHLLKIEFHDEKGEFIIQALWDDRDEHNDENNEAFKKWAYNLMGDKGYEVRR